MLLESLCSVPVNNFSVRLGCFLSLNNTKQNIKCLAPGHNIVPPVRLKSVTLPSQVEQSTTEPVGLNSP